MSSRNPFGSLETIKNPKQVKNTDIIIYIKIIYLNHLKITDLDKLPNAK